MNHTNCGGCCLENLSLLWRQSPSVHGGPCHIRRLIRRHTIRERLNAKLRQVKATLRRMRHMPIPEQGRYLRLVLNGFYNYYAVPTNFRALNASRTAILSAPTTQAAPRYCPCSIPGPSTGYPGPSSPRWSVGARVPDLGRPGPTP